MTATTVPTTSTSPRTAAVPSLWRAGLAAGAVAAVATTVIAEAARLVDIPVDIDGESIPILGFAQMTLVGAVLGILLAAALRRRSAQPRRRFLAATVALTALSCVPDVTAPTGVATKLTLIATHLVAAAVIVPRIAQRLPESR